MNADQTPREPWCPSCAGLGDVPCRHGQTPRRLLGWTVPDHVTWLKRGDGYVDILCRFSGTTCSMTTSEQNREWIADFLQTHAHGATVEHQPDAPREEPGCCGACDGTGNAGGYPCSDCCATGHCHDAAENVRAERDAAEAKLAELLGQRDVGELLRLKADLREARQDRDALILRSNGAARALADLSDELATARQETKRALELAEMRDKDRTDAYDERDKAQSLADERGRQLDEIRAVLADFERWGTNGLRMPGQMLRDILDIVEGGQR